MKARLVNVLLAIAIFCVSALAQENTAGYWIEKGNELVDNGSFEESLMEYDRAIQIDPENLDAWNRKAEILYALEQQAYRNVLSLSERRIETNPRDARAWQARAVALLSLGEEEEANSSRKKALDIYDQEIRTHPENATAWFSKAELTANRTEALTAYEKVIELNGSMKIAALLTKGNILANLGRPDEAIATIDEAIQLNPNKSESWKQKALNSYVLGDYNESLAAYEKVIELDPGNAFAWIWKGKGDALKALGRQTEADEAYAKAWELGFQEQEDSVDHWLKRGQELYDNGSYEEATWAYEKAISLDPNNASAWLNFGESLILRRNDEALAALNRSLELNSQNADAWNSKGSILSFMNRRNESLQAHAKALEITNNALETNPQDAKAWQSRAAALSGLGRLEEYRNAVEKIVEIYEQTLEANPQNAQAWWEKALYLSALGRYEEALQAYDRIIELNSTKSARAWVFKAYIFDPQGRYNESLQAYDRAIELTPVDEYWRLANIWDQKGLTLQRISGREAANEAFEKAALNYGAYLQKNPNSSEAWKNLGQDLYNLGRYEEALDAYDEAIESGQNYGLSFRAMLWNGKGKALQAMGKDREAAAAFSKAKELGYQE